jgi:glycosyltransferase involved in cell wall biosynthesis
MVQVRSAGRSISTTGIAQRPSGKPGVPETMNSPDISIVLATQNALPYVGKCLDSICPQLPGADAELIVADASTDGTNNLIRTRYPQVRLLAHGGPVGLPELMREALQNARGRIVALIDPGCVFAPDWLEKLRRAHNSDYAVIGGAVENGQPSGITNWACYMVDYGAFRLPAQRCVTSFLPGIHLSYKQEVLKRLLASMSDGYWKVFFHSDLTRQGVPFLFEPDLVTYYWRPETSLSFLRRYYRRGRYFAARRCEQMSIASRVARVIGFPALPVVLVWQRVKACVGKKSYRVEWLLSLPLQVVFLTGWALGEWTSFLLGPNRLPREVYQ